jgi:diguanylate cyclase (GGDEF)-like protein
VDQPADRLTSDRDEFRRIDTSLHRLVLELIWALAGLTAADLASQWLTRSVLDFDRSSSGIALSTAIHVALSGVALYFTSARPIRRDLTAQRRIVAASEEAMLARVAHQTFLADVHNALEMGTTEADALSVVGLAMAHAADSPAELLIADSSRAHLRRQAVAPGHDAPGCGAEAPWDCPAVRRGQNLRFEEATTLGACPRLRERSDRFGSALCVPINILGAPTAVLHAARPAPGPWDPVVLDRLDGLADQAGARLGVLRAMARSQLQAETDPLTGLLNRRAMEERVRAVRASGARFAVALADLDQFKQLNDRHGHETGDRALRTFSRVMSEALRSGDILARHGGEEFVVVLPGLDAQAAALALERVRDDLRAAVGTALIPAFTVSMGVADSTLSNELADLLRAADHALMQAKAAGRDRIVVSQSCDPTPPGAHPATAPLL